MLHYRVVPGIYVSERVVMTLWWCVCRQRLFDYTACLVLYEHCIEVTDSFAVYCTMRSYLHVSVQYGCWATAATVRLCLSLEASTQHILHCFTSFQSVNNVASNTEMHGAGDWAKSVYIVVGSAKWHTAASAEKFGRSAWYDSEIQNDRVLTLNTEWFVLLWVLAPYAACRVTSCIGIHQRGWSAVSALCRHVSGIHKVSLRPHIDLHLFFLRWHWVVSLATTQAVRTSKPLVWLNKDVNHTGMGGG